jgi:uncharacterized protein
MAVSLHTVVVGTYQQMLPQVARLIDKAEEHCKVTGTAPEDFARSCLAPDMWPFSKQVEQCAHHSQRAIEAVRVGNFAPQPGDFPHDFGAMRKEIADALAAVNAVDPGELDAIAGNDMQFKVGSFELNFTVADFLMSFSLPNFYFHVATAYNLVRMSGAKVGKMDYLGRMRTKA